MSTVHTMQQALTFPAPRRPALLAGLAISALLHALLLLYVRLPPASPVLPDTRRWSQPLTVRLVPPPPPVSKPVPEPKAAPATATTVRPARPRSAPPQAIAVAPERSMPAAPASAPATEPAPPQEPRLDLDAARASARGLARDLPSSDNWAAEKLAKERGLQDTQDEKLGKNIARSARPDCRNGQGGLLAPLLWMMDKKDSGCKF